MFSGHIALNDPIHDGGVKLTYSEAASRISKLAGGLQALRLTKGDKIGLFAENSYRSVHTHTHTRTKPKPLKPCTLNYVWTYTDGA